MSVLTAHKYIKIYKERNQIKERLDNRHKTNMSQWDIDDNMYLYRKITRRLNTLISKIDTLSYNEMVGAVVKKSRKDMEVPLDLDYKL